MSNKKYKILLIQLPAPEFSRVKRWGNVPLAAGYLKAMAYKEGLLNEADIEILGERHTNLLADSRLIDLIISKSPDMLGFSLYVWNSIRSLFIAREVKKKLPNLNIIVGGPEVTLESKYILENSIIDIGCIGEGEIAFVKVIKNIIEDKNSYANVEGIFYRKSKSLVFSPGSEIIKDLNEIPSPFALGFINPADYETLSYESIRGCPFKCSYCVTGLMPIRYFSKDRICEDLKVILKSGKREIRFVDSDFTFHPDLYKILKRIKGINSEKILNFSIFIHGGRIDRRMAGLLKECNFLDLEIGLQTIKPKTLDNIKRQPINRQRFIKGLRLLEAKDISYSVDIMIGLPGDTIQDLKRLLRFIKRSKVISIIPFVLAVLPGTRLKKDAKRYGIRYQDKPPYLLIEADYISKDEIKEAVDLCVVKDIQAPENIFLSHCNFQNLKLQKKRDLISSVFLPNSLTKAIIELNHSCQEDSQLRALGQRLNKRLYQPFTVWFKSQDIGRDLSLIKSFFSPLVNANPYLIWDVILEAETPPSLKIIENIKKNIRTRERILTNNCNAPAALNMLAVFSWGKRCMGERYLSSFKNAIQFFWSLELSNGYDWRKELDILFNDKHSSGILIDFDKKSTIDFTIEALKFIYKKTLGNRKNILFRDLAVNYSMKFIAQKEKYKDDSIIKPVLADIEPVLSFDKDLNISSALIPSNETMADLIEFQIRLQKALK